MATGSPKYSQKHGQKKEGTASRHSLHLPTSVSPSRFPSCLNRQHTAFLFGGQTVPNPTHNFIFSRIPFQRQNIARLDFIRPVIALQLDLYHVRHGRPPSDAGAGRAASLRAGAPPPPLWLALGLLSAILNPASGWMAPVGG